MAAFQVASSLGPHPLWAAIRAKSIFLARCATSRGRLSTRSSATAKFCLRTALAGAEEAQILDLRRINIAGRHLLSLVTDVLHLSKIEAEKMDMTIRSFDPRSLIDDVVATRRQMILGRASASSWTARRIWASHRRCHRDPATDPEPQQCGEID